MSTTRPMRTASGGDLFARNATGLVRGVSSVTSVLINYIPGSPVLGLSYGFFLVLSLYPGGNFLLALLLLLPMALAYTYSFGLLTSAMPRSGGDYVLVSRILHPVVGVISSFYMQLANGMFSTALGGWYFTTLALGPDLIIIGLISGDQSLVNAGNTILTSKGWQFGIGVVVIIVSLLPFFLGWASWARMQAIVFLFTMSGLVLSLLVALFTGRGAFHSHFNHFANPITHNSDTYAAIIAAGQKAGVVTNAGFSFSKTLPMVAFVAAFGIYAYFTSFVGGEIRQGSSLKTAHRMALGGLLSIVSVAIGALIFFHSFGRDFLATSYGGGMPKQFNVTPTYFFLTSAQLQSTIAAIFLVATFALFWPLLTAVAFLQPTRMIFAYSFDGLLPRGASKVSGRNHAPVVAIVIAGALAVLTLFWAIFVAANVFQVVTYTVLAQVVSMGLVGVAALLFPYRRPELFRASTSTRRFAGIPVVSIAGAGAILSTIILWILYFTQAKLGLADKGNFFLWIGGTLVLAVLFYFGATAVRRRQGVALERVYSEIPPE
jgi:basic amino acid/polyamine antiporter, APA family